MEGQWAAIPRDVFQNIVHHLFLMAVLDAPQWVSMGRVCKNWRHCVASLLAMVSKPWQEAWNLRLIHVEARCYLEPVLLRHYPHRIHALSCVSMRSPATGNALAHILQEGCGVNLFQLPLKTHCVEGFLRFFNALPYSTVAPRAFIEDYTGDLFVIATGFAFQWVDLIALTEMERALKTRDGRSVFTWHSYGITNPLNVKVLTKRNCDLTHIGQFGLVLIFRNRDPDVNAGREFDYTKRQVTKSLRSTVQRKRSRPELNTMEKRLVRMCLTRGAEEEDDDPDDE